jgi:hypothetical protein
MLNPKYLELVKRKSCEAVEAVVETKVTEERKFMKRSFDASDRSLVKAK